MSQLNLKELPHRRLEAWKWTDIQGRVSEGQKGLSVAALPHFDLPAGVTVAEVEDDDLRTDTPMADLARALGGKVWQIDIADGQTTGPISIANLTKGHSRIRLNIGAGADVTLIEHYAGEAGAFSNLDITIKMDEGAKLARVIIHDDPEDHLRVSTTHFSVWAKAHITQHTLSFGGALSRLETRLAAMGKGINATLNGAYLLDGKRHCDMTSHIDLTAPDSIIRQSVKGVVTDKARGVFQGKFHVRRPAQHTDAEMRHDALMLSDTSEVRAKPELEIYADDVACAHGNTLGQLDESALFYMRQRGIPISQARAMLTEAFLAEVFDDLKDEELRESVLGKMRDWLEVN